MLALDGDKLADSVEVTTASGGVLRLDGDQTVRTYTSTVGELSGIGSLITTDGAVFRGLALISGRHSGDLRVETGPGAAATVSGWIGDGTLSVDAGTLVHTGTSANGAVVIGTGSRPPSMLVALSGP